jgi:glutamine synthetase
MLSTSISGSPIRVASGSISPTMHETITEDFLNDGVMFDGSSIAGWKAINESDMVLVPVFDPTYKVHEAAGA